MILRLCFAFFIFFTKQNNVEESATTTAVFRSPPSITIPYRAQFAKMRVSRNFLDIYSCEVYIFLFKKNKMMTRRALRQQCFAASKQEWHPTSDRVNFNWRRGPCCTKAWHALDFLSCFLPGTWGTKKYAPLRLTFLYGKLLYY